MTIQMKAIEQFFPVVLLIVLYKEIPRIYLTCYKLTIKEVDMLASCTSALVQSTLCEYVLLHRVRRKYRSAAITRSVPIPGPYIW